MKRNHEIKVRFNDEEYNDLLSKVSDSKLSREKFIRNLVLNVVFKTPPPIEYFRLVNECNAIGRNLNQLTKLAYIHNEIDEARCKDISRKIENILEDMEKQIRGV